MELVVLECQAPGGDRSAMIALTLGHGALGEGDVRGRCAQDAQRLERCGQSLGVPGMQQQAEEPELRLDAHGL